MSGFELEELLHRGPCIEVWRARSASGERVAVKMPTSRTALHSGVAAWLEREHAIVAALNHPGIVRAVDYFAACREDAAGVLPRGRRRFRRLGHSARRGERAAFVMEYLGGGDLVSLAGAPAVSWLGAASRLVSALEHVHERGFVHGDVKARNVLFAEAGGGGIRAKLADFGSALPIGAAHKADWGTAAHRPLRFGLLRAAPEEDVYALAVLLYELFAGCLPFGRDPLGDALQPDLLHGSGSDGSRNASSRPRSGGDARLEPLAERVHATLLASRPDEVGTLREFADVIESVGIPLEAARPAPRAGKLEA